MWSPPLLRGRAPSGTFPALSVEASPAEIAEAPDVILFAVKLSAMESGAEQLRSIVSSQTTIYTVQVFTDGVVLGPTQVTACASSEEGAFIDANLANNCKTKPITVVP